MIGIEIKGSSLEVQKEVLKRGLVVLTAGEHVIRLLPPLIINENELMKGLEILINVINTKI